MDLTSKNLDSLTHLLTNEAGTNNVVNLIPSGAHIFHGSDQDTSLTKKNLRLASKILLGMTLGYVEEAPIVMVVKRKPDELEVIDLTNDLWKSKAHTFVESFHEQNQQQLAHVINPT